MAPEYPPGLLIFDARNIREEGGEIRLMGDMTFIETPLGQLRVRWGAGSQPAGFLPVGGGVAYVFKTDDLRIEPAIDYPHPDHHGNLRFRWEEGLKSGIPWIMFILILPEGYTITEPHPAPARAQIFDGRLALYWMLRGDEFNRTYIECTLKKNEDSLSSELLKVRRRYLSSNLPNTSPNIEVENSTVQQDGLINPWLSGSFYLFAAVVLIIGSSP